MTGPTVYLIGLSGRDVRTLCDDATLYRIGAALPPGSYWIREAPALPDGTPDPAAEPEDWGTLEVAGDGGWHLTGPGTLEAGPGYILV